VWAWIIKINEDKIQAIHFPHRSRQAEASLTMNERNIPFVNRVKYLGVIFDKRITRRLHIETISSKAFRTFIRAYSLLRTKCLNANIKLTLYKALIRPIMTYACPIWELAADTCLLKLQRLKNKVLRIIDNFPRRTPTRELHVAVIIPYIHEFVTQFRRQQAKVIQSRECNCSQHRTRQSYAQKVQARDGGQAYGRSSD
jgi:hypothetical protein